MHSQYERGMKYYSNKHLAVSMLVGLLSIGCDGGTKPDYYTGVIAGYVIDEMDGAAIDSALVFPTCKADSLFIRYDSIIIDSLKHGGCNGLWDRPFVSTDESGTFRFVLHYRSNPDFTIPSEMVWLKAFKTGYRLWKYDRTRDSLKYLGTNDNISNYEIVIKLAR